MRIYGYMIPIAFIGIICMSFLSCEKKIALDPVPPADTILSEAKMTGKWEVVAYRYYRYRNDTVTFSYQFIKDYGGVMNGVPHGSYPWIASQCTTYITFRTDHTFFYADMNGGPDGYMLLDILPNENTSWTFKDPKTIELTSYSITTGIAEQTDWQVLAYNAPRLLITTLDTTRNNNNEKIEDATFLELERQ